MFNLIRKLLLKKTSTAIWVLIVAVNFASASYIKKWIDEDFKWYVITFDVATYYSYLPAAFYGNLKTFPNYETIKANHNNPYKCSDEYPTVFKLENGNRLIKTTYCMSLLYLPAFISGHIICYFTNDIQDGFTTPYQISMSYWFIVVSAIGLWYLRKILLLYSSEIPTSITLAVIAIGTNYWYYVVDYGGMPHNFLFTLYGIALWNSIQYYNSLSSKHIIAVAICSGLAFCSRPTEILLLLPLFFWNVCSFKEAIIRVNFWFRNTTQLFIFITIFAIPFFLQIVYWKWVTDQWFFWSYKDEFFDFTKIHYASYLWGTKKGWLYYTPVMIFAIVGLVIAIFQKSKNALLISIFLFITISISAAWHNWWYGGSFSQRSIIQSYVFLSFPLCFLIENILQYKKTIQYFLFSVITILSVFNIMISTVCIRFYIDFNEMNKEKSRILIQRSTIEYVRTMLDSNLTYSNFYHYKLDE